MKGRKPLNPSDKKMPVVIFLSKNERDQLPSDLSAAIRLLTKGGKYEQMVERCEMLTKRLKDLGIAEVEPRTIGNINYQNHVK